MFASASKMNEMPEVQRMRHKILRRIFAFAILAVFVVLLTLDRINILKFDTSGVFGTSHLLLAIASILYIAFDRDSYLPFLGECVLPPSVLAAKTPQDAAFTVDVLVPNGATHVMYWASESGAGLAATPYDAYGNYANAGIVQAGSNGKASLPVRCPRQYRVRGRALPRHVHYRAIFKSGVAGPVQTTEIACA